MDNNKDALQLEEREAKLKSLENLIWLGWHTAETDEGDTVPHEIYAELFEQIHTTICEVNYPDKDWR